MDHGDNLFVSSNGSVESGWTVYLDNSSSYFSRRIIDDSKELEDDDEELDLSMVSDASSGPQIFPENHDVVFPENDQNAPPCFWAKTAGTLQNSGRKMKGGDERQQRRDRQQQTTSFLDDTATSDPNFNFNNSESSTYQNQFNTMRQSSPSGIQRQNNQWFKGKRSSRFR